MQETRGPHLARQNPQLGQSATVQSPTDSRCASRSSWSWPSCWPIAPWPPSLGTELVRREADHRQQTAAEADEVGPVLESVVEQAWQAAGDRGMRESLRTIHRGQRQGRCIRWVWFDAKAEQRTLARPLPPSKLTRWSSRSTLPSRPMSPTAFSYLHVYWPVALAAERKGGLEFTLPVTELEANEREIIHRTALLSAAWS